MIVRYVKLTEDGEMEYLPKNDNNGEITGKIIVDLKSYFDENPELWKQLGWFKIIEPEYEKLDFDKQTERYDIATKRIDEFTFERYPVFRKKTEYELMCEEVSTYVIHTQIIWGGH